MEKEIRLWLPEAGEGRAVEGQHEEGRQKETAFLTTQIPTLLPGSENRLRPASRRARMLSLCV